MRSLVNHVGVSINIRSVFLAIVLIVALVPLAHCARDPSSSLDICISNQQSFQCGTKSSAPNLANENLVTGFYDRYRDEALLTIDTEQIFVTDAAGRETAKLDIPGIYRLVFNKIIINRDLDYLVADLRIVIKPNIGQESFEIFTMPDCDGNSHKVRMDGKDYCRYCDLCDVTRKLEEDLISQKVFDPLQKTEEFDCRHLDNRETFRLSRTITIPNTDKLEGQYDGVDGNVKKHLENGNGKIVAHLRLLSKTAVDDSATHGFKSDCIINCINNRGSVSLAQCRQNCEYNIAKGVSGSVSEACVLSTGYMGGYQLAGCYDVEFDFKAANITQQIQCQT